MRAGALLFLMSDCDKLKIKPYPNPHVIFFVLIAKMNVVRAKLLVVLTECLPDWYLMKESQGGPPAFAAIMNTRSDEVS